MATWSNERKNLVFGDSIETINIRCRLTNMMLATQPANKDVHADYIASKAPDAKSMEEELATHTSEEVLEKGMTVYPVGKFYKTPDNVFYDPEYVDKKNIPADAVEVYVPFIWDYQWKGSFKEAIQMLTKASGGRKKKDNGEKVTNNYASAKISNYKKVVDGNWFVKQRKIPLLVPDTYVDELGNKHPTYDENGRLPIYQRPLRVDTMQGPRVALATSEFVPAGTEFYMTIELLNPSDKDALLETLDYKAKFGMLQWRGGGKGTLIWTLADENGKPID